MYKLNDNQSSPKKVEKGYNPAYKYDLIYNVLVHNTNYLSKQSKLNLCGDETTCGYSGHGESGTGLLGRVLNKTGVTMGMQTVLLSV